MGNSITLKRLSFNLINFSPELISDLTPGITNCASLQVLDFSYNSMSDFCGAQFLKVLRTQADMRDQHIWMASLRGRAKLAKEIGLREFHLKFNKLGAMTADAFSKFIDTDEYLRVIDMSNNLIKEDSIISDLIPSLRFNKSLTNFDLRENPGYTRKVRKLTALCLLRNIDLLKKAELPSYAIGKTWLNPDCLLPKSSTPGHLGTIFDLDDEEPGQENKGVNRKRPGSQARKTSAKRKPLEEKLNPPTSSILIKASNGGLPPRPSLGNKASVVIQKEPIIKRV